MKGSAEIDLIYGSLLKATAMGAVFSLRDSSLTNNDIRDCVN
jgi:hypothetical protein